MESAIQQVRAFNRTVTRSIGALSDRYLGRDRPLVESRLLFEVGSRGALVREIRARLGLDSGFLSRILRSLERKGLVTTPSRVTGDRRVRFIRLTRAGLAELRRINALSDQLVRSMLNPLSTEQAARLVTAMTEVERLLRASSIELTLEHPRSADAQRCLEQYFREIDARFQAGFDRQIGGSSDIEGFAPPEGHFLVARLFGEAIGCGGLRVIGSGIGEIKRMWVAPSARGLGIGRRILQGLEEAAACGGLTTLRLDTNRVLAEARKLYQSSGYHKIARFNDNPYAHHWFEKVLAGPNGKRPLKGRCSSGQRVNTAP